jgi:hypothetical protein
MGFVQNNVDMLTRVSEFTQIARVDLQLRENDSGKISKNLKLPTCASISVQIVSDPEILQNGFCLECGKLSKMRTLFQNSIFFGRYGWIYNWDLPKLMKNPDLGICSKNWQICF